MAGYPTGAPPPARDVTIAACLNPLSAPPPASRILVVRLGAVGDVVRTLPAARALRDAYPEAELTWLVEPPSASLLEGQPWLDRVLVFPRPALREALAGGRLLRGGRVLRGFLRELRAARFDLVLDFHAILKSGLLVRASGGRRRITYARPYAREGAAWLVREHARLVPPRISRFTRNDALVHYLGVEASPTHPPLVLPEATRARAAEALGPGPAPVAIHPGTSPDTPHKRWTAEGYGAVARALAERDGVPSVVTAGAAPEERAFARAVVEASGDAARLAPETPSLLDLAALFARARLYLGGDTGPMHVASLVGTPVVQLLGPTDPVENTPYPGTPWRRVRVQVGCNPCRRGCATVTCMRVIPPDEVLEAVRALLAAPEGRR